MHAVTARVATSSGPAPRSGIGRDPHHLDGRVARADRNPPNVLYGPFVWGGDETTTLLYCNFFEFNDEERPQVARAHRIRIAAASVAVCSLFAGTALGVNTGISAGNGKTLSPNGGSATVDVGDTVTWTWVGPDTDHIMESGPGQAESWDSDPGAGTNPNHGVGDTFAHQFTHAGAFNYHCRVHPDKMFGVITVNATGLPASSFTVSPASGAIVGQTVSFDGSGSSDPGGVLMSYQWDLDGDGSFETTGVTPTHVYATAGTVNVKLRVTDNLANQSTSARDYAIADPPPPVVPPAGPPPPVVLGPPPPPQVAKLVLSGAARQRAPHRRGVTGMATCDLACTVTASGSITIPGAKKVALATLTKTLAAGVRTPVVLTVPKASRAKIQKLLAAGKVLRATLVLRTADGGTATRAFSLIR